VLLLVATLVMTGLLAYEAQHAARSHRAVAESVLRDYAAFAAWELSRTGRQQLLSVINSELSELQRSIDRRGLEHSGVEHLCAQCGDTHRILATFHIALPSMQVASAGDPLGREIESLFAETGRRAIAHPDKFTCPELQVVSRSGLPAVVVFRPTFDRSDSLTGIVGFVSDSAFIGGVFGRLLRNTPLLPESLVRGAGNANAALVARVTTADGTTLFSSTQNWSPYSAERQLERDLGGLKLAVALEPVAAAGLVIGGLPRQRLPLVMGLLTLTVGLVVVALVQLRREAELSRLRSDFVSGVSHELRTPLAQIRLFTETLLLGRVRTESEARHSLEIVGRETQRLTQLVENVLYFARGERRQPILALAPAKLAPIVSDVLDGFGPLAAARQARIVSALDPAVAASVDPAAIRQILLNLLDNAVKYGPPRQTVTVSLHLDGTRARLVVDDEGPGIDAGDAERIFEPFNRLTSAAAVTGGAGIGLAIVRQLATLHNGRASVERGPAGARFIIEIPGAWSERPADSAVA
jgi:signal transduction histidine kinase